MDEFKIVADSSADTFSLSGVPFASAPLRIVTPNKEYVDDGFLDIKQMTDDLLNLKEKSSTSCPNTNDWISAFGDSKYTICVTISGNISGSYNSACLAKDIYEEMYPDRKVAVFDSQTAGPEITLFIEKARELILAGKDFESICKELTEYNKNTELFFILQSLKNFANNGRINPIIAKTVGLLGIRIIGIPKDGQVGLLEKCRGAEKTNDSIIRLLKEKGLKKGRVIIAHCLNESGALEIKERIEKEIGVTDIKINTCSGLCSYYAEQGGFLVGFEKF